MNRRDWLNLFMGWIVVLTLVGWNALARRNLFQEWYHSIWQWFIIWMVLVVWRDYTNGRRC